MLVYDKDFVLGMSSSDYATVHESLIPLRWGDFDRFGHVNNAAYVELAQEARLRWAQDEFGAEGFDIPPVFVRKIEVDYLRPMMPSTDKVRVETVVTNIGRSSFTTRQTLHDGEGHVCATVHTVQVAIDLPTSKPRQITEKEMKVLTRGHSS
ncbi:thioesterase [Corynebacterium pelargi]|uniref:Acyl-CoA thioesterase YbgC n=2 Tax=Corynebacterium pelargi TaxID=1471400 RepID=A0A410W787_9CORY|nr:acyl-CoA thioesterase YbgC [Corynebacterium pelargi]GGG72318.1 thioesterase [Corynebacterium pelargi]